MQQDATTPARRRRTLLWIVVAVAFAAAAVWGLNYVRVSKPVAERLGKDTRNNAFTMAAHYRHYVDTSTLVLDLTGDLGNASTADMMRGLFNAAGELHKRGQSFDTVILARAGKPVFLMSGEDFAELGRGFEALQNPIYLSRTLPEKLRKADGTQAFGTWTGGWLGVLSKQMDNVNQFGRMWATAYETIDPAGNSMQ